MSSKLEIVLSVMSQGMEGFTKAGDHVDGLKKKTDGLSKATDMLKTPLAAVAIAAAAAAVAMKSLNEGMQLADSIRNQADALAISTQAVQEWNYAAKQSGGSAQGITTSFEKLTTNIYSASEGNKELTKTFNAWGIELTDTKGNLRDVESITNDTMNAISGIKDPIERAGVATQLLGKGSKDLLPMLAGGTEAMNAQRKAAGDLGQVLSEHAIKALDDAGDTMDTFNQAMKVANAEMVSNLAPAFTTLATLATKAMSAVGGLAEYVWSIGEGFTWLAKGQDEWEKKMQESNAIGDEVKEMAALKKEYEETIVAQEALKKSGGSLFAPDELWQARQGLEAVNEQLHLMNTPKAQAENSGLKKAQQEAAEKAQKEANDKKIKSEKDLHSAIKKMQADANKDYENSFKNVEESWKNSERIKKEAVDKEKKESSDKLARAKKLDSDIDKMALAGEKDETKRRQLGIKQEQRDIDKAYKEQIKDANGNAQEIAKINELKNASIRASNESYNEWFKQAELAKRDFAKSAAMDTLSTATNVFSQLAEKNKEWGNVYKTAAIAQTIVSTYQSAQASYTGMVQAIPGPGGIVAGFVAAASAVTTGLMRVNEIRKQNFASGTNGPLQNGTWGIVGEMGPELLHLPGGSQIETHHKTTQLIDNSKKGGTTINLTIHREGGTVVTKLTRAMRNGSADYVLRQIKKSVLKGV